MKLLSTLFFSSAVAFAAIGNAASETVAIGWGESYTLETGKVLTFLHCAHELELGSVYGYVEILGTIQGEVILFSARPEHIVPTLMLGGTSHVSASGVPATNRLLVGPATISPVMRDATVTNVEFFQLIVKVEDAVSSPEWDVSTTIPQAAVVIPSDATGPVEILMESSEDMVNWSSALPGLYGTSTEKRFFRVRAERHP